MQSLHNLEEEKDLIHNELSGWKKIAWERLSYDEKHHWATMINGTKSAGDVARIYERHFAGEEACGPSSSMSWHQEY